MLFLLRHSGHEQYFRLNKWMKTTNYFSKHNNILMCVLYLAPVSLLFASLSFISNYKLTADIYEVQYSLIQVWRMHDQIMLMHFHILKFLLWLTFGICICAYFISLKNILKNVLKYKVKKNVWSVVTTASCRLLRLCLSLRPCIFQ